MMEAGPKQLEPEPPLRLDSSLHNHPYEDKEMEAVMGPEGGGGWYWGQDWDKPMVFGRPYDPMEVLSKIQLAKIGEKLWNEEEMKPEEIPQGLQEEIRESGAITVALRDVRTSIGKDRQQWKLALEAELQSLRDTGAIAAVKHVPRNKQILPMKVVLTSL